MFARNGKIARVTAAAIAYTWGEADHPAQGGTLDTWRQIKSADKVHVSLSQLAVALKLQPLPKCSFYAEEIPMPSAFAFRPGVVPIYDWNCSYLL